MQPNSEEFAPKIWQRMKNEQTIAETENLVAAMKENISVGFVFHEYVKTPAEIASVIMLVSNIIKGPSD